MKSIIFLLVMLYKATPSVPVLYVCRDIKTTLYSEAPLEDIEATSVKGFAVMNINSREVQFNVPIRSFKFKKSLMQEHFNENYMESDKFPNARFKGKINEQIDFFKNGAYPVTVSGELEVHGVKKMRTITGSIKISDKGITVASSFIVPCSDHDITIPKLVFRNVAENIHITVTGDFLPNAPKP